MNKILFFLLVLFSSGTVMGQKVSGKLRFEQGKTYTATMTLKNTIAQQAMGQAIDFVVDGKVLHNYKVTNATDDNTTLHHQVQQFSFAFDGMGQKRSFDSDNKKDLDGQFGKPIKELLGKTYDVVIDANGKTLMAKPEKIELSKTDDRITLITDMLRDLTSVIYPPQKGEASFFKVLPEQEIGVGETWTESRNTEKEKSTTDYTLFAFTDSTILVNFKSTGTSLIKSEMMGTQAITNMNNTSNGQIVLDKLTGIIKQKTINIESNGATEAMGSTMPLTAKTTIVIVVMQD